MNTALTLEDFETFGTLQGDVEKKIALQTGGIMSPVASIDTRHLGQGDLFFALKGDNTDGHAFVGKAFEKGARLAAVSAEWAAGNKNLFSENLYWVVPNVLTALQRLANMYRRKFTMPVIAITGSSGKTTTKDMTAAVLAEKYRTLSTQGNLNNLIGVPLTLFGLRGAESPATNEIASGETEIAVIEMGMNHYGEIAEMCRIAEPTHGLITNIGAAHIEFFGSRENIAIAKGELFEWLGKTEGNAFVFSDDKRVVEKSSFVKRKVFYGTDGTLQGVSATLVGLDDLGCPTFKLKTEQVEIDIKLRISGRHNMTNALAAATVGLNFGVPVEKIKAALETFEPKQGSKRMEVMGANGVIIINDCYNANPDSMRSSLETLMEMKTGGKKIAVLGDMLELGEQSAEEHESIAHTASELKVDVLLTFGEAMETANEVATVKVKRHFGKKSDLAEALKILMKAGDAVLVKGSRGMQMEEIVQSLKENLK
ncbi:MAG: UDP-N-acetylmuramoyl-tripeptide--D-alanyl-D-alanine ligase [Rhizobacter sp.]|nr:UDP-N-acetylmuramoyl-tripeptide--D-alanyl-D-alanine ligase [Chlorobiales bacterium]